MATPDGKFIFVANYSSGTVSVIDTATNTIVGDPIATGVQAIFSVVTPDSQRVYVSGTTLDNAHMAVVAIDTATRTAGAPIITGTNAGRAPVIAMTPNGRYIYVTDEDANSISVIDTSANSVVGTPITVPDPIDLRVTPDGKTLYVTSQESNSVFALDTATNTISKTISVAGATELVISPDGARVYVSDRGVAIRIIDSASNTLLANTIAIPDTSRIAGTFTVSPDGRYIYLPNDTLGHVTVVDTTTGAVKSITTGGVWGADWSARVTPHITAVSADGRYLYVGGLFYNGLSFGTVQVIDTLNGTITDPIVVGGTAWVNEMIVAPSGMVYAVNNVGTAGTVAVIDPSVPLSFHIPGIVSPAELGPFGEAEFPSGRTTPTPLEVWRGVVSLVQTTFSRAANAITNSLFAVRQAVAPPVQKPQSPTTTAALYDRLRDKTGTAPNSIWIDKIDASDGIRYVIYFGGTIPTSLDPRQATLANNLPSYNGVVKPNQWNVIARALTAAGGDPTAPVMLVGYSQGGLDAQNVAQKLGLNVTAVVLYAAPLISGPPTEYPQIDIGAYADPVVHDFTKQPQTGQHETRNLTYGVVTSTYKRYADQWWYNPFWAWQMHGDKATYIDAAKAFDNVAKGGSVPAYSALRSAVLQYKGTVSQSWK
ncbi:beta-propeller fold lactonase family protein [Mycobacterium sp. BK086]|uniref:beta-propeller fold lactonase family protein n=1 Tax=Mycobacterium sp. BK086 TaxID=2512165 RepID=UPI0014151D8B|nr:beta-propeller fold lactonase family protein [Mycobacterium sp. BK086]